MKQKVFSIILFVAFVAVMLQPIVPFAIYFTSHINKTEIFTENDCDCQCNTNTETTKMQNNGDAYLKALIKRVCDDKKKKETPAPVLNFPIFVNHLYSGQHLIYQCPQENYNRISTFIIQPNVRSYIADIFHPPALI